MKQRHLPLTVIAMLAIGLSACATKKKDLPPPPPVAATTLTPATPGASIGEATTTVPVGRSDIPGSAADFVAQAGSDTVLFPYDSYDIDDEARTVLGKQAEWLARYPAVRVAVEGHADERGTREYNLALGDRRATAAKNFLAAQGIATSRMTTISFGKERPTAEGTDEAAFTRNRRAVTVVAVTN